MSPQIIIFMEFVYSWLRMDSKELKKYEKFPVNVNFTTDNYIYGICV